MDHIKSQLDNLADLNDEQITALEASIVSQFDEFADAEIRKAVAELRERFAA